MKKEDTPTAKKKVEFTRPFKHNIRTLKIAVIKGEALKEIALLERELRSKRIKKPITVLGEVWNEALDRFLGVSLE